MFFTSHLRPFRAKMRLWNKYWWIFRVFRSLKLKILSSKSQLIAEIKNWKSFFFQKYMSLKRGVWVDKSYCFGFQKFKLVSFFQSHSSMVYFDHELDRKMDIYWTLFYTYFIWQVFWDPQSLKVARVLTFEKMVTTIKNSQN